MAADSHKPVPLTLAPEPVELDLAGGDVANAFQAGFQFANQQAAATVNRLEAENERLSGRNEDLRDELERTYRSNRDRVDDLRAEHDREIRQLKERADEDRRERDDAVRKLEMHELEARVRKANDSSVLDKLLEPLIPALGALGPALLAQPQPAPVPVEGRVVAVHPTDPAPDAASSAHAPGRDAAAEGAPSEADDVRALENLAVQAILDVVKQGTADTPGLVDGVLARFLGKLTPSPARLARVALAAAIGADADGSPAEAVAAALAPVVAGQEAAAGLLRSLTPEAAVSALWSLASLSPAELTPDRSAYLADVLRAVAERVAAGAEPEDAA